MAAKLLSGSIVKGCLGCEESSSRHEASKNRYRGGTHTPRGWLGVVLLVDKVWLDSIHGSIRRKMKIGNASMQIKDMVFPKETAKKTVLQLSIGLDS